MSVLNVDGGQRGDFFLNPVEDLADGPQLFGGNGVCADGLEALAALGCLGNFVGMLTDSRSFLSYTRHEYFRRILCQKLGKEVENGEIPADMKWLGQIVEDISYNNAKRYFGF